MSRHCTYIATKTGYIRVQGEMPLTGRDIAAIEAIAEALRAHKAESISIDMASGPDQTSYFCSECGPGAHPCYHFKQ